jgi:hypothetical protein
VKVFLAGEGKTELGEYVGHPSYWPQPGDGSTPGVLEALLRRAGHVPSVVGARTFRSIRKYRAGVHRSGEHRSVLGLFLHAEEHPGATLVFTRDRDGDPDRARDIEAAIAEGRARFPGVSAVGGVAREAIEAWILELLGDREAESHRRPKGPLEDEHGVGDLAAMVEVIEGAALPPAGDGSSLCRWLAALAAATGGEA